MVLQIFSLAQNLKQHRLRKKYTHKSINNIKIMDIIAGKHLKYQDNQEVLRRYRFASSVMSPIMTGYLVAVKIKISFLRITKAHTYREIYTILRVAHVTRIFCCLAYIRPLWRHKSSPLVGATVSKRKDVFYERYCANFRKSKPNIGRSGGVFQYWDGENQRTIQHRELSICPLGWKQAHDKTQENGGVSRWCVLNLKLN